MRRWMLAFLTLLPVAALAADSIDLKNIDGVYKKRFANGDVQGDKYQSEDILEIVTLDPQTAYVRAHLEFYNGHLCTLATVGKIEGNALVMRPQTLPGQKCALKLSVKDGKLSFEDTGDCRSYFCGARGSFQGEEFPLTARRPIRYMKRLKASQEFADALKEAGLKP